MITIDGQAPIWAHEFASQVNDALSRLVPIAPRKSIRNLPPATPAGQIIIVTDATAGKVLCVSEGGQWLELQPVGAVS